MPTRTLNLNNFGAVPFGDFVRRKMETAFAALIGSNELRIDFTGSTRDSPYQLSFQTGYAWTPVNRDRNWYRPGIRSVISTTSGSTSVARRAGSTRARSSSRPAGYPRRITGRPGTASAPSSPGVAQERIGVPSHEARSDPRSRRPWRRSGRPARKCPGRTRGAGPCGASDPPV